MKNMIEEYGMVLVLVLIGSLLLTTNTDSGWFDLICDQIKVMCDGSLS